MGYLQVDPPNLSTPPLEQDIFYDMECPDKMPYTLAVGPNSLPHVEGSVRDMSVPIDYQMILLDTLPPEGDAPDSPFGLHYGVKVGHG